MFEFIKAYMADIYLKEFEGKKYYIPTNLRDMDSVVIEMPYNLETMSDIFYIALVDPNYKRFKSLISYGRNLYEVNHLVHELDTALRRSKNVFHILFYKPDPKKPVYSMRIDNIRAINRCYELTSKFLENSKSFSKITYIDSVVDTLKHIQGVTSDFLDIAVEAINEQITNKTHNN